MASCDGGVSSSKFAQPKKAKTTTPDDTTNPDSPPPVFSPEPTEVEGDGGTDDLYVKYTNVEITPKDSEIIVEPGKTLTPVTFTAKGTRQDTGVEEAVKGTWSFSRIDAADFTGSKLVPSGLLGAKGDVSLRVGSDVFKTSLTVKLRIVSGSVPSNALIAQLDAATDDDATLDLVYPPNGVVFPRGLGTTDLQWNGIYGNSKYRIRLTSPTFEFTGWADLSQVPLRYAFPTDPVDVWTKMTDSSSGEVTLELQRHDGTKAYKPKTKTIYVAPGNLSGSIYYTRLASNESFIRRIEPGKSAESFLAAETTCLVHHSVSKDGSRVIANNDDTTWSTFDVGTGDQYFRSTKTAQFQAISPDGQYVILPNGTDTLTMASFDSETSLVDYVAAKQPQYPVVSPDGKLLAFSMDNSISLADVTFPPKTAAIANVRTLAGPGDLPSAFYGSFSPDSQWYAFQRSSSNTTTQKGELWLVSVDGKTEIRLDAALGKTAQQGGGGADGGLGGGGGSSDEPGSWEPTFHPISAGGYFWLAFSSNRIYGNTHSESNRQLWITAIDAAPEAGKDPSHPAFYVSGQDLDSTNLRGQFTLNKCKPLGEACKNGFDCCDGYCRADASGKLVCQTKGDQCAPAGDKCEIAADCCSPLSCIGGFCAEPGAKPK